MSPARTNSDTKEARHQQLLTKKLQTYNHTVSWKAERTEKGYHRLKKTFEQLPPKGQKGGKTADEEDE